MVVVTGRRVGHKLIDELGMVALENGASHLAENRKRIAIGAGQHHHRIGQRCVVVVFLCQVLSPTSAQHLAMHKGLC